MNSTIILIIISVLIGIFVFFIFTNRKSNFEKRLTYHTPRYLPHKRQEYINQAKRYIKKMSLIIGVFMCFPLMIMCAFLLPNIGIPIIFLLIICMIAIECLGVYLLYCFFSRNIKNQQALLEQMSDNDFELLLSLNKESMLFKYFPPFILCKDKLYFFGFTVQEIDPASIKQVTFTYAKGGNVVVRIKSGKLTTITFYKNIYPFLVEIIKRYSPEAEIETLE